MKAKDFLKSKKIWLGTKVADMNAPENYFDLENLLEDYHQAKLKLLDIPCVMVELPKWKTCKNCDCGEFPKSICDCSCHD